MSYTVSAVDPSGNESAQTAAVTATPTDFVDTAAPTTPTNLTATPGVGQVVLSWTASTDNVGVTGYKVRRSGTLVGSPTATTFTDSGLTGGTQVSYTVSAIDAAGNESAQTAAVTATPTAPASAGTASETWTGTDGSPWPSQWTTWANDAVVNIQSNRGRIARTTAGEGQAYLTGMPAVSNFEYTMSIMPGGTSGSIHFGVGAVNRAYTFPVNGHLAKLGYNNSGANGDLQLNSFKADNRTELAYAGSIP
ncbi:MAG: fibronectin type III domain-containing protein, partial [Oxalobacteraceae bacterium]